MFFLNKVVTTCLILTSTTLTINASPQDEPFIKAHGKSTQAKRTEYQDKIASNFATIRRTNQRLKAISAIAKLIVGFKKLEEPPKLFNKKTILTQDAADLLKKLENITAIYYDHDKKIMITEEEQTDIYLCGLITINSKIQTELRILTQNGEEESSCYVVSYIMCKVLRNEIYRLINNTKEAIGQIKAYQQYLGNAGGFVKNFTTELTLDKNTNQIYYLEQHFEEILHQLSPHLELMQGFIKDCDENSTR